MSTPPRATREDPLDRPIYAPARNADEVARQVVLHAASASVFDGLLQPDIQGVTVYGHRPSRLVLWEAGDVRTLEAVYARLNDLKKRGVITFAEQNRIFHATTTGPSDPYYRRQWALRVIEAEAAWERAAGLTVSPAIVAIVDSGIDMDHSDLSGHYYMGTPGGPSNPGVDEFIHGTLLAGTIGAVTNNNEGIAGVFGPPPSAPIRLMSAKFFEAHHFVTSYNASVAVWVAVDLGADVINASWDVGVAADYLNPIGSTNDSLRLAIEHAVMQNVVVVAAAGNDGTDNDVWPTWPARYSGVIAVMATDRNDARPAFSNYGAKTVHIAAPGVDVLSTYSYRWGAQGTFAPTKYHPYTGTSPAAAHVSGAAALLRALQPGWSATMLRDHLIASADPVPWLTCVARGRLNLRRAVRGPIRITVPSKGDTWTRNTLEQVYWQLDYQTPAVKTVTISLETGPPPTPPIVLAQGVLNNGANGACSVWVPNVTTYQARIKIVSDQAAFIYAESGHFSIQ